MENYGIGTGKRMLFVYNPKAGKAKIRNKLSDIVDVFARSGYSIVVHPTQGQGDAREVVKNREKGAYDLIVCSGGDGTLDEVVAGMMQTQEHLPVGYIPAGSTKVWGFPPIWWPLPRLSSRAGSFPVISEDLMRDYSFMLQPLGCLRRCPMQRISR